MPCASMRQASTFLRSCRRKLTIWGSSVGPSTPQLLLWLSLEPSRLSSPLASLWFVWCGWVWGVVFFLPSWVFFWLFLGGEEGGEGKPVVHGDVVDAGAR